MALENSLEKAKMGLFMKENFMMMVIKNKNEFILKIFFFYLAMEGSGNFKKNNGEIFSGNFKKNKVSKKKFPSIILIYLQYHGKGKLIMADGGIFEGNFCNGKKNGQGIQKWNIGNIENVYSGNWEEDEVIKKKIGKK